VPPVTVPVPIATSYFQYDQQGEADRTIKDVAHQDPAVFADLGGRGEPPDNAIDQRNDSGKQHDFDHRPDGRITRREGHDRDDGADQRRCRGEEQYVSTREDSGDQHRCHAVDRDDHHGCAHQQQRPGENTEDLQQIRKCRQRQQLEQEVARLFWKERDRE